MLEDLLSKLSSSGALSQISQRLGISEDQARNAVGAAVPSLVQGMQQNAQTEEGAQALHDALQNHDGSVNDDVEGYLANPDTNDGEKIVGHVLGDQQQETQEQLGQQAGIGTEKMGGLMAMLGPMVMGALGKSAQQQGAGASDLSGLLGSLGGGNLMGMVTGFLDKNKDGSVMDDLQSMAGNLFHRN